VLTPESFSLLRLLSAQTPCAGHKLADQLNLPRTKIAPLIAEIESAGIAVERVNGKGYILKRPVPWFNLPHFLESIVALGATPSESRRKMPPQTLTVNLPLDEESGETAPMPLTLQWMPTVDSTSRELMRRAPRHDVHGQVVVSDWQSAGRGRRGREWTGVIGGSLLFSLAWRFDVGGGFLSGLPLAMSVALCRALEKSGYKDIHLKWPNDLVHNYQKLGGILIELSGDALGPTQAVIGVGLNLLLSRAVKSAISQPVTDLGHLPGGNPRQAPDREALISKIILEMIDALRLYAKKGFLAFASEWQRRHIYHRAQVRLALPDGSTVEGLVVGVDANGALVLQEGNMRKRYTVGDMSLRKK
jgi:BirA family biotin operon repressor/biotin-[acetyl-CoA-carboxylase] ligase